MATSYSNFWALWIALGALDAILHLGFWLYAPRRVHPMRPLTIALGIALCVVLGPLALVLTATEVRAARRASARARAELRAARRSQEDGR